MNRLLFRSFAILAALSLVMVTHPLQSDANQPTCEVDAKCIGRLPYYEPLVLLNPVMGGSMESIGSRWGDRRDNGKRSHEGMDIFARRGTPVLAPVDGVVTKVGWNLLGGKVIWLTSRKTQHSYYFAHLAEYSVCKGDTVRQGDKLGTVGTTGNARFTPPHLHFGIYLLDTKRAMNREIVWKEIPAQEYALQQTASGRLNPGQSTPI